MLIKFYGRKPTHYAKARDRFATSGVYKVSCPFFSYIGMGMIYPRTFFQGGSDIFSILTGPFRPET